MATNTKLSRFQVMALGAGYGRKTARDAAFMGAYNREVIQDASAKQYARRNTEKVLAMKVFKRHIEDGTRPPYFTEDRKSEWEEYSKMLIDRDDLQGSASHSIQFSDIYKIRGPEEATNFANISGMAGGFLGIGKWLDASTTYGTVLDRHGNESLGVLPQIATIDERSQDIRSTAMTVDGSNVGELTNVADLEAWTGGTGEPGKIMQGINMDVLDAMDRHWGEELIKRGGVQDMARILQPDAPGFNENAPRDVGGPSPVLSSAAQELLTEEEREIIFNPTASRARKSEILQNAITRGGASTAAAEAEVRAFRERQSSSGQTIGPTIGPTIGNGAYVFPGINHTAGVSQITTFEPHGSIEQGGRGEPRMLTGAEVNKNLRNILEEIKSPAYGQDPKSSPYGPRAGSRDQGVYKPSSTSNWVTSMGAEDAFPGYIERGGHPFGVTDEVWSQQGVEGRKDATRLSKDVDTRTRERDLTAVNNILLDTFKKNRTAEGSSTNQLDIANDALVQEFYKTHGMKDTTTQYFLPKTDAAQKRRYADVKDSKLMKRFRDRPDMYEQFVNNPHKFALDVMQLSTKKERNAALYGPPVTAEDRTMTRSIATTKVVSEAGAAIKNQDMVALQAAVLKVKAPTAELQARLVAFNQARGGDMNLLPRSHKISTVLAYMAALPKDHPTYKALLGSPMTLANFVQTGNWTQAAEELQLKAEANQQTSANNAQRVREWIRNETQDMNTGNYSPAIQNINKNFMRQMEEGIQDVNLTYLGQLVQEGFGNLVERLSRDPKFEFDTTLANDFAAVHRMQAMLIKQQVLLAGKPNWWQELFTLGFASDPDAAILELNAGIKAYDRNNQLITDINAVNQVAYFVEQSRKRKISAFRLTGDLGKQVIAHLLASSLDPNNQ